MKIGELLLLENKITLEQLQEALLLRKTKKDRIGKILIDLGYVTEEDIMRAIAKQKNVEFIRITETSQIPESVKLIIPKDYAIRNRILAISADDTTLTIATGNLNDIIVEDLKHLTGFKNIVQKLTLESDIIKYYESSKDANKEEVITQGVLESLSQSISDETVSRTDIEEIQITKEPIKEKISPDEVSVIRVVNEILLRAIQSKASDIHIEPYERGIYIRYRIDGMLYDQPVLPAKLKDAIVSRIKVMSKRDIAEHRLPQDGRAKIRIFEREVDLRVSTIPTVFGEKVVIRILDPQSLCVDLSKLGMEPKTYELFRQKIRSPHGIILVTGPTGSGKTTTLYSTLTALNSRNVNILTAEDPVEYILKGINQVQIFPEIGLTFANALRSFLRQDPNIIMVGEIRDFETAEIAINAALTGHLVLSTLHTNDSIGVITRLENMGVEPFLISSTLILSVAQRLLRKLCDFCKQPIEKPIQELIELGIDINYLPTKTGTIKIFKQKGCEKCKNIGYSGRIGCYEMFDLTAEIREMILHRKSTQEIKEIAVKKNGFVSLRQDATKKMLAGITSLDEVLRVSTQD